MGSVINTIINNDLLFYGIIVFLIVGVVVLFMFLGHKKKIDSLEDEIENPKINDDKNNLESQKNFDQINMETIQNNNAKKMDILNEEITFTNNKDNKIAFSDEIKQAIVDDSSQEIVDKISELDNKFNVDNTSKLDKKITDENVSEIDGKSAIDKILNETIDDEDDKPFIKKRPTNKNIEVDKKVETIDENNLKPVQEEKKSELEVVLEKMQHDLEEQKDKDAVAIFEQEQEEKSIISYKELLERKHDLINSDTLSDQRFENEPEVVSETGKSLADNYVSMVENVNNKISIEETKKENTTTTKKFVTTDFISPVFGRQKAEFDYPKVPNFKDVMLKKEKTNEYDLETTLNLDPLREQMKKDDAFLSALKEFRKNLE